MEDSFIVEVKPSVINGTPLTKADFDNVNNMALSEEEFDGELRIEFTSREDAELWVSNLWSKLPGNPRGRIHIQRAHPDDQSEIDAYLQFKPIASER